MIDAAIVGGSGYVGGELLRLLLFHHHVNVTAVTSESRAGRYAHTVHPNLREVTGLQFIHPERLPECDLLFLCLPHGRAAAEIDRHAARAHRVIDCSADFRLRDPAAWRRWYGEEHPAPEWLERFVYGLPERHREELAGARWVSGVGCNATAANLALGPLADAGLLASAVCDIKVGSSEGGARGSEASHHPERSGAVRSFKPTGHRHQAEVHQELGTAFDLHFSVTSIERIRGVLATAHAFLHEPLAERDLWRLYRQACAGEPFLRLVKQKGGLHRLPDPKVTAGSNFADLGFAADPDAAGNRVVVLCALDNLVKGAAGTAVQCMNLMSGWEEGAGLSFPGLHP